MTLSFVPAGVQVLKVSDLTRDIKVILEDTFPMVWVSGEISGLKRHSSGHIYLALQDKEAQIRAVIWRSAAARLRFEPRDGMEVIVRGRLSVYPPRGEYQLSIEEVHAKGLGARELALRQLREKLQQLGYFAAERKRRLPRFPRRVALLTSPTGAAVRDMLEILKRWPLTEIWVCPVRVQGEGASEDIAAGIRRLNRLHQKGALLLDVVVLGRGGGSSDDLWEFNQECLAKAIFESLVPIVSAVGHEIDVTTADLVADLRALTPSEAATRVVPDGREIWQGLKDTENRLRLALTGQLDRGKRRLDELAARRALRLPLEQVRQHEQKLDDITERLKRAIQRRLARSKEKVEAGAAHLESLSPLNVLKRGYSLTRKEADQSVVRGPEQVRPGDRLVTVVERGRIVSRVEEPG